MYKKCIYCGKEVLEKSVIDICALCGKSVWGENMFNAIVQNMEEAKEKGDLMLTNQRIQQGDPRNFDPFK